ncbi:MAG: SGNH/GDSL hydrolase family protein [Verrucomicrobia bacterium]|nr:SGNH/GDSL hydrolase family protein [Verrucomicrobiota bacterium]
MKNTLVFMFCLLSGLPNCFAADAALMTIPVDSPAFVFSPGNWTGDAGRAGKVFRQTWNPGAYFRVTWESKNPQPVARLRLDLSINQETLKPSPVAYSIDGIWKANIPCAGEIAIEGLTNAGRHELAVYVQQGMWRQERWGSEGKSGQSVMRVTGLQVDADSIPAPTTPGSKWAMIVGDSITEGCGASVLAGYSHLVGQALRTQDYEYCLNACGWSGWIHRGDDGDNGDVPGYYTFTKSTNGVGGQYDDAGSRWNKVDNNHSLLDSQGHMSDYGQTGQEPSLIMINYGTNDDRSHKPNPVVAASITQCLAALRASAPNTQIIILIPFGQYCATDLKDAVDARKKARPADTKIDVIDLGPGVARNLDYQEPNGLMGGLHPNDRGHANFAAAIIPQMMKLIEK